MPLRHAPSRRLRHTHGHPRGRVLALTAVLALFAAYVPTAAMAASVTSAVFTGGAGTYRAAPGGMLYARQGAALTLTVNTDANTQCVEVIQGSTVIATLGQKSDRSTWTFSGTAYPWLLAGGGNGLLSYTTKAWRNYNAPQDKCTANQNETFGTQAAAYTLDNTAPTASGTLTPAPNGAGWNRSDVTVTWTGSDTGGSGVNNLSPTIESVTTDGTVTRTTTVIDNVGNTGTGAVQVKLDKTAPTITGSRTPAANANGWNNTDVTASFTASDATSGIKTSPAPTTLTGSAAGQSVLGTAVDNADNGASATVGGINIDKIPPTLSGLPTSDPNAAGWYDGDVTIAWTAADALSGVTTPADSTVSGEGTGLTASTTATDRAGNSTSAQSPAVRIDRTAPNTTVTAPPAWNRTDVTLALVASDALSGVEATYWTLDDGPRQIGTSVPVSAEGSHTLRFWSTDNAGNTEAAHTVTFGIDRTSPTIGHTRSPAANADGWNNTAVTVTFTCSDAVSGLASCTEPVEVSTEGAAQTVTGTVHDNAGNVATDPATVNIDLTAPIITVDPLPAPTAHGWYGSAVTATFTASDALSGIKTQDRAYTFGEGEGQTATATATDAAGNSGSVRTPAVNVDTTAPTLTGAVIDIPNANGWFTGDVTVRWTCADNLSGVLACPPDSLVTGEGGALSASASSTDLAGHTATATVADIRIDRTAPGTTATDVPAGWVNAPVTVGLASSDNLSGVDSSWFAVDGAAVPTPGNTVTIGAEGVRTVSYWSVDRAGNVEDAKTFTVKVDLSSPSIHPSQSPEQNANGWNNADVTVSFACADQTDLSGLATCAEPATVTTEGRAQLVTGTASDNAGNSTSAAATVNIDLTPPAITGAADRDANTHGWYDGDVTVSFAATDALSGIDTVTGPARLQEGRDQSVTGTATDAAGNAAGTTMSGIDIDTTPPTLSAAPTSGPNANGWYNTDVTQSWAADDMLSGLAGEAPADSVLTAEGEGLTASAAVTDRAGNTTSATSAPVRIDRTAPATDVSAPTGWVNDSAEVTLTPHDALSGVEATQYAVDGGATRTGRTVTLTDEGTHAISYFSTDAAGNVEATRTVSVRIDRTAPTITHTQEPVKNGNGWNNTDVTVTFTCADQPDLSGVASCTAPRTVTTEGRDQAVTGTATDNAGNTAVDPATVSIDKTPPTISGSRAPVANEAGWNNTDVSVHFDAADEDGGSGIDTVTADTTVGEGSDQSVDGTAVDAAGNSAGTTVGGINVDRTPPTLAGMPVTPANTNGWYNADVTIAWTATDDRSGVAAEPADTTITGEGSGLTRTVAVSDRAGNSTTAESAPVNIDRTAPTTGADAPTGWNNSAVTVSLSADDGLSGVDATYYSVDGAAPLAGAALTVDTEGVHTLTYWSTDAAGNAEPPQSVTLRVDLTRPVIGHTLTPAPNGSGWNNAPVTVAYRCDDALSGVASCPVDTLVDTDGRDQVVPGTAVDNAGNTRTDDATVSIDTVSPTVTGAPDRAPNPNGWYAGDVEVSFRCADDLSGIAECSPLVHLGEGAAQTADGTAIDAAGNTDELAVGPINVDKTPPTLTGSATGGPNAAGWYSASVTVAWSALDALSGIDGPAPAESTIGGEGTGLTTGTSVDDRAGNRTSATSPAVNIDRTAPTTIVSAAPVVSEWSVDDVTVTLVPSDNLSGVAATFYQLDGEAAAGATSVSIATEGVHSLQVWSVDAAGNVEAHQNIEVKIDRTAPGISHDQAPAANARGWNNSAVTVTFTCTDTGSGIASCTAPQTVATEGQNQPVVGEARDHAGNTTTDTAGLSIDRTGPVVGGRLSTDANSHGWFNAAVTVSFTCADQQGLSGVLSCPASVTLAEGAGQSAGGTAVDAADNPSDPYAITGIDIDTTDPELRGTATTAPNDNGWYGGDVIVTWTATDALSGIDGATPADSTITGEGEDLSAGASVSDRAGNTVGASVGGIRIDRHDPGTTAAAASGWQSGAVTVTLTATDNLSGVAVTYYTVDGGAAQAGSVVLIAAEGTHAVAYWSIDRAGNTETARTATVLVDRSAPTITGAATTSPNSNGWYGAPVTVRFTCADAISGIAGCQPDATLAAQGANSVTGTAVDNAGNTGTTTVSGIDIDTVAPTVTIGGVGDGATYVLGAVPAATASATDATSGLAAPATGTEAGGTVNGVGTFTYTATATDRAGNVGTATATYRVRYGYGTTLFLQPVNDTAHQTGVATSVFNAGQTIPMKFQLRNAAGQVVQAGSAPRWLTPTRGGSTAAAVNEAAYSVTVTSGATYTWNGTAYQYNWKTDKAQAGSYWRVGVALDDGQTYYVNIGLR